MPFLVHIKLVVMKWETVTSTIGNSAYALWNNGIKLVTLVFNPSSSAARMETDDEKRVFLIRKEGFLKNKTVLRNEYGIRIGQAGSENNVNFIELNDERYFYSVENNVEQSVTIYKDSKDHPLAVCDFDMTDSSSPATASKAPISEKAQYSLLMALCWYLFKPVIKEPALEFTL